jgi:hypothetical protein
MRFARARARLDRRRVSLLGTNSVQAPKSLRIEAWRRLASESQRPGYGGWLYSAGEHLLLGLLVLFPPHCGRFVGDPEVM